MTTKATFIKFVRTSQVKSSQDTYTRYERNRFTPQVQS